MINNYIINHPKLEESNKIVEILNFALGENYITQNIISQSIKENLVWVVYEEKNNKIIGVIVYEIKGKELLSNILILKSVVVLPEHRKKGVSHFLISKTIEIINNQRKYKAIESYVWESKEGVQLAKQFEENGFILSEKIKNYWYKESIERNIICPDCGCPPCMCTTHKYCLEI